MSTAPAGTRPRPSYAAPLLAALGLLVAYCAFALVFAAHCGPGRVAVVGVFGLPECVCKGASW